MFVCVARVTIDIPAAGSLKGKRQVLRRVTDRVKAKFNVAVAEVEDNDVYTRGVIALAVVGNERRHVNEMMDKILQYIEDMYVAPVAHRELEILSFGEDLFTRGNQDFDLANLTIPRGERSLAEAEGLGDWDDRHARQPPVPQPSAPRKGPRPSAPPSNLSLDDARALARSLRNRREWERSHGGGGGRGDDEE
ncbi:MAG: DUF503 domain-containing protein [Myxococcaceae bacterium]|jgi:hypothetical protein|nr:DUF503 domain-containing protein [Myxococcaceae bacterium]